MSEEKWSLGLASEQGRRDASLPWTEWIRRGKIEPNIAVGFCGKSGHKQQTNPKGNCQKRVVSALSAPNPDS